MPIGLLTLLAALLYVVSAVVLALPMLHRRPLRAAGLAIGAVATALHAWILFGKHGGGVDLHFFAALSLVGACIAALCLLVNLARPVASLGVVVFPLAAKVPRRKEEIQIDVRAELQEVPRIEVSRRSETFNF